MTNKKLEIKDRPKCIYHGIEMYLHGHTKDGRQKFICPQCGFTRLSKVANLPNGGHSYRKFYTTDITAPIPLIYP